MTAIECLIIAAIAFLFGAGGYFFVAYLHLTDARDIERERYNKYTQEFHFLIWGEIVPEDAPLPVEKTARALKKRIIKMKKHVKKETKSFSTKY